MWGNIVQNTDYITYISPTFEKKIRLKIKVEIS